jgi:hypothetical protein
METSARPRVLASAVAAPDRGSGALVAVVALAQPVKLMFGPLSPCTARPRRGVPGLTGSVASVRSIEHGSRLDSEATGSPRARTAGR